MTSYCFVPHLGLLYRILDLALPTVCPFPLLKINRTEITRASFSSFLDAQREKGDREGGSAIELGGVLNVESLSRSQGFTCGELRYRYKPRYPRVIYDFVGARAIRRH